MKPLASRFDLLKQHYLTFCVAALFCFCAVTDFLFARAITFNSDMVQSYNQLAAINAGNYSLHGWYLATDNFYLTDLPFYAAAGFIFGDSPRLIYIIPFIVFMLFLLACIFIVRRPGKTPVQRHLGAIAVIILLGFPFADAQKMLVESDIHAAAIMFCIVGYLCAQPLLATPRGSAFWLIPFTAVAFVVAGSDPQADAYFIGPLAFFVFIRLWLHPGFRPYEWALCVCVALGAFGGIEFIDYITHHGGFYLAKNYSLSFVADIPAAAYNFIAFARSLQLAFDASPYELRGLTVHLLISNTRFLALLVICLLCFRILWRAPRAEDQAFTQLLGLGALCLAASDVMSQIFAGIVAAHPHPPVYAVRYAVPAYVLLSLAGVIEGQDFFSRHNNEIFRRIAAVTGFVLTVCFLFAAAQAAIIAAHKRESIYAAPQLPVARWLAAHHFTYGVGDYWTAQVLTALGHGKVFAGPVLPNGETLSPFLWVGDMSNFIAGRPPQFAVFSNVNAWNMNLAEITATYGKPRAVYTVGDYTIAQLLPIP